MRNYELTLFLDSAVGTQEANDILSRVCSCIQDNAGLVDSQDVKGGITLRGAKGNSRVCFMAAIRCAIEAEKLPAIKASVAKDASIVRSIILQTQAKQKFVPSVSRRISSDKAIGREQKKEAINVADIDKEIEEIVSA